MNNWLKQRRKLCDEATDGPWAAKNENALDVWLVYPPKERLLYIKGTVVGPDEPKLYPLEDTEPNAKYIASCDPATMRLIYNVIEAAIIERKKMIDIWPEPLDAEDTERLSKSLEALQNKVGGGDDK